MQFYGVELWFGPVKSTKVIKQFEIGYHKTIKKLLNLSSHESNHFACQEANLFIFSHLVNKMKIDATLRVFRKPCIFFQTLGHFINISSVMVREVHDILKFVYEIDSLLDNDYDAIMSRIWFV